MRNPQKNAIGTRGVVEVVSRLSNSSSISSLDLSYCCVAVDRVKGELLDRLQYNTSITDLNLRDSSLRDMEGLKEYLDINKERQNNGIGLK